jgi:glycosyltransferase involved in cell wall biosynthesis
MKIAMIQDDWWPQVGGGPIHVRELAISLAEAFGHEIDIYTRKLREDGETHTAVETYAGGDVRVLRRGPTATYHNLLGRLASVVSLVPFGHLSEYDVVHGHTYLPAVPTKIADYLSTVPTVFTIHGTTLNSGVGLSHSELRNKIERRLERAFILGFDYNHVISVNREHLDMLADAHDSVSYVPNGIDVDRFEPEGETESGRLLYLGRLAREKRVVDIVESMPTILEAHPGAELVVVGTGPERQTLEERAAELGVADSVEFAGRVSDEAVVEYYSSAQVFVLPSIWEGHPLTLLEAWASETPVVASDTEGITEFVEDGTNGRLIEPKNTTDIASTVTDLLDNPEERRTYATNGRELVESEYTWRATAERTNDIYQTVQTD